MSFREKSVWVTLFALLLVSALYLVQVGQTHSVAAAALHAVHVCFAIFLLIELVGFLVLRWQHPAEARAARDELERLIELKALRIAAYTYIVGSFLAIFLTLHVVGAGPGTVGMAVMLAFVFAAIVRCVALIIYYRRHA